MLGPDDLTTFRGSVARSMHRVQPDAGIRPELQLGIMQYFIAGHATGVGNPIIFVFQRYGRCALVAGAVVDLIPLDCLTGFWVQPCVARKRIE